MFFVGLEPSTAIEVVHGAQCKPVEDTEQDQIHPLVNNPAIISSCNCSCCIVVDAFCNTVYGKYQHRLGGIISLWISKGIHLSERFLLNMSDSDQQGMLELRVGKSGKSDQEMKVIVILSISCFLLFHSHDSGQ